MSDDDERIDPRGRKKVQVRTNRGRTTSSKRWLDRQLNDPYVQAAKSKGYRSRAAFKIIELDKKFGFLRKGARILDLGAAPGGWTQIAVERVGEKGKVVAMDILAMEPMAGATVLQLDMRDDKTPDILKEALGGKADLVMSDMAAPTTGHRETDHIRTIALLELVLEMADDVLKPGGAFIGKVFQGGASGELLARIKRSFSNVKHVKPPASRAESVEVYLVAMGFRPKA